MTKNNSHQNFTLSLGILTPPPYLGIIPKKMFFLLLPLYILILSHNDDTDGINDNDENDNDIENVSENNVDNETCKYRSWRAAGDSEIIWAASLYLAFIFVYLRLPNICLLILHDLLWIYFQYILSHSMQLSNKKITLQNYMYIMKYIVCTTYCFLLHQKTHDRNPSDRNRISKVAP